MMKKARLILSVLLTMPFAWAADGAPGGDHLPHTYHVSSGAKDKALLMRVFNAVQTVEQGKHAAGARKLEVRQRISSTEFVVNAGGATDYWFIALEPRDWDNRDRFHTDAEFTDATKTFRDESGRTITFRVLKQVQSKPAPAFTKEDFVQRLKDGETWTLMDFEQRKCPACGGDGMIDQATELVECDECFEGILSIDYVVEW